MLTIGILIGSAGLVALALWTIARGKGGTVTERDLGGINTYDAYYGKDAHSYGGKRPCDKCASKGCIGLGLCRCSCHKAEAEQA